MQKTALSYLLTILLMVSVLFSSCDLFSPSDEEENTAPVASAGDDITINLGTEVTLDGGESSDADSDTLTYSWKVTSKPAASTLADTDITDSTSRLTYVTPDVEGIFEFEITVNDGTDTSSDIVRVTVSAPLSQNTNLSELMIDGVRVTGFDPSVSDQGPYSITVPSSTSSIEITATPADSYSTLIGMGTKNLSLGQNNFTLRVTAIAGNTKDYTLQINRSDFNTSLNDLQWKGTTISGFSSGVLSYNITEPYTTTSGSITATAVDNTANITGTGAKTLNEGSNQFDITVTATDGSSTSTYTVYINRTAGSSDADLSNLTWKGSQVSGFNSSTTTYTISAPYTDVSQTITATAHDSNALVSGDTGLQTLSYGSNVYQIVVTAENGTTKTYTLYINKAYPPLTGMSASQGSSTSQITVSWNSLDGADSYNVEYYNGSGWSTTYSGPSTSFNYSCNPGEEHTFIVYGLYGGETEVTSAQFSGYTSLTTPQDPSPTDNAPDIDVGATLSWDEVLGASSYDVYIWIDGESEPSSATVNVTDKWYTPSSDFQGGTTYNWYVKAVSDDDITSESAEWSFTTPVNITANLWAEWNLDTALDSSGNGNNLTVTGTAGSDYQLSSEGHEGGNPGLELITDTARFQALSNSSLSLSTNCSISLWIKGGATDGRIISRRYGGDNATWEIDVVSTAIRFGHSNSGTNNHVDIDDSDWHHFAFTCTNGEWVLFHNGLSYGVWSEPDSNLTTNPVRIGDTDQPGTTGFVDDIKIYTRALGPAEVMQLYQQ